MVLNAPRVSDERMTMMPSKSMRTDGASRVAATGGTPTPGWKLNFAAGFVPLIAGVMTLVTSWLAVARPDTFWWTGAGSLDFSYTSLRQAGTQTQPFVELTGSVGGVNVVAAAVAVSVVAWFGLRAGHRWAWWFLAFCLVWVGIHDAAMATRFFEATGQPVMLLPYTYCALMLAGLLRSRKAIFVPPPLQ
ncbi:hypothetical protein, partial [Mycolicibacterium fortuitum]